MKLLGGAAMMPFARSYCTGVVEVSAVRGARRHRPPALGAVQNARREVPKPSSCVRGAAVFLKVRPRGVNPLSRNARVGDRDADTIRHGTHLGCVTMSVHSSALAT